MYVVINKSNNFGLVLRYSIVTVLDYSTSVSSNWNWLLWTLNKLTILLADLSSRIFVFHFFFRTNPRFSPFHWSFKTSTINHCNVKILLSSSSTLPLRNRWVGECCPFILAGSEDRSTWLISYLEVSGANGFFTLSILSCQPKPRQCFLTFRG